MVGIPLNGMARSGGIDPLNLAPPPQRSAPASDASAHSFQSHLQVRREPDSAPPRPEKNEQAWEAEPPPEMASSRVDQAVPAGQDSHPPQEPVAAEQPTEQPACAAAREQEPDLRAEEEAGGPPSAAFPPAAEACRVTPHPLPVGGQLSETARQPDEPATEQVTPQEQQPPCGIEPSLAISQRDEDPPLVPAKHPPERTSVRKPRDASGPEGVAADGQAGADLAEVPGGVAEEAAEPAVLPTASPLAANALKGRGAGRPSSALTDTLQLPIEPMPSRPASVQGTAGHDPQEPGGGPVNSNAEAGSANGSRGATAAAPATHGLAQHLLPQGGERANAGVHLSGSDQARLVERVARAVRLAEKGQGVVRLRLSPPELGALKLEVRVHTGVLAARLEVETALARHVLVDNLPVLRDRLGELGVRVEQFDVDVADRQAETPSGGPEGRDRGRQDGQGSAATAPPFGQPAEELLSAPNESALARVDDREHLNVVI